MENPFDKFVVYKKPSVVKFDIKLLKGELYDDSDTDSKIKINLNIDTYIPYETGIIQSLDFNLYAMNDRSDVPSSDGIIHMEPAAGIKVNVNELIKSKDPSFDSHYNIFQLNHDFEFVSPFIGTNYNLLGVNVVINRTPDINFPIAKESIYTTVVPTYYLSEEI